MAIYSITVKKGKFQLDLSTTDRDFVVEQFALWVKDADDYAKKMKTQLHINDVNNQIQAEKEVTEKNIAAELARHPVAKSPDLEEQVKPKQDTTKMKSDVKEESLDIFYAPPSQKAFNESIATVVEKTQSNGVFDTILENSLNNPKTELTFKPNPSIQKDSAFINYMGSRKIERKVDYLLCAAYYFTQYEQKPRFTLKQLNSKLMQNLAVIIDHSVLQEAINRDYIECLPDLTGLVGASEYRLTAYGEKVLLDE